jgi:hypothetical protein
LVKLSPRLTIGRIENRDFVALARAGENPHRTYSGQDRIPRSA